MDKFNFNISNPTNATIEYIQDFPTRHDASLFIAFFTLLFFITYVICIIGYLSRRT
jgi:hypothetical protein